MIDKLRRKRLALHLRHLATGQITNDDFESSVVDEVTYGWLPEQYYRAKEAKSDDQVIQPILEFSWTLYDDLNQHKLTKQHQLPQEQLKDIARYILFLHSDLEYRWPYLDVTSPIIKFNLKDLLVFLLTLGHNYRKRVKQRQEELEQLKQQGAFSLWPFYSQEEYRDQLGKQPFLNGQA
jgi:hypothetical protein